MTFIVRRLSLGQDVLAEPVLRRESLDSVLLADQLLEQARAEAEAILAEANQQRDALLKNATVEFWQAANASLAAWDSAREAQLEQVVKQASQVLRDGLQQVLGRVPRDLRLQATLRQLAASQPLAVQAGLQCHSDDLEALSGWLQELSTARFWELIANDHLQPGQLRLETPSGDFNLDWSAMCDGLQVLVPSETPV